MKHFFKKKIKQIKLFQLKLQNLCDTEYTKRQVLCKSGKHINLDQPELFIEKLQWLKLNKYKESYQNFADKYEVRKIVADKVGPEVLNELYQVYDSVEAIKIDELPNEFVLKCTHGSGYNVIVKDKSKLDWPKAKVKLTKWMRRNYYNVNRERVYKDIKPRIIAEKYLSEMDDNSVTDYKFFCFNGKPEFVSMRILEEGENRRAFYDMTWNKVVPDETTVEYLKGDYPPPANFSQMKDIATKLADGFAFIRIDLYSIGEKVYFGEITFFPSAAIWMIPHIARLNKEWGDLIDLSKA